MNYLANALQQICSSVSFGRGLLQPSRKRRLDDASSVEGVVPPKARADSHLLGDWAPGLKRLQLPCSEPRCPTGGIGNAPGSVELQPSAGLPGALRPSAKGNLLQPWELPEQPMSGVNKRIRRPSDVPLAPAWPKALTQINEYEGQDCRPGYDQLLWPTLQQQQAHQVPEDQGQQQIWNVHPRTITTQGGGTTDTRWADVKSAAANLSFDEPYDYYDNDTGDDCATANQETYADNLNIGRQQLQTSDAAAACGAPEQISSRHPILPPLAHMLQAGCSSNVLCLQDALEKGHVQTRRQHAPPPQQLLPQVQMTAKHKQQLQQADHRLGRRHVSSSLLSLQDSLLESSATASPVAREPLPPPTKAGPSAAEFLAAATASLELTSALSALQQRNVLPLPGDLAGTLAHMYTLCYRAGYEVEGDQLRNPLSAGKPSPSFSNNTSAAHARSAPHQPRLREPDWLLAVLWVVECVSSQYRGELSDVLYDYLDFSASSSKEARRDESWWRPRLVERQLEVLQACEWRVTITAEELAAAIAELQRVGSGEDDGSSASSLECGRGGKRTLPPTVGTSGRTGPSSTTATGIRRPASFAAQLRNSFMGDENDDGYHGNGGAVGGDMQGPRTSNGSGRGATAKPRPTLLSRLVQRVEEDAAWRARLFEACPDTATESQTTITD